jgi:hypothetical protein
VQRGFCRIKQQELLDVHTCQLAAKLTADATCRTGNQHHFAAKLGFYLGHVDFNFVAPQEVFNAKFVCCGCTPYRLSIHPWKAASACVPWPGAITNEAVLFFLYVGMTGKENVFDLRIEHQLFEFIVIFSRVNHLSANAQAVGAVR